MNKKRLSVVMAGAMLASSVAPVLAAEATTDAAKKYDVSANDLGILKRELRTFLSSKKFHIADEALAGQNVYYITKNLDKNPMSVENVGDLKAGDKLYVWSHGFKEDEKGNVFSQVKNTDKVAYEGKYTLTLMENDVNWFNNISNNGKTAWDDAHKIIKGMDVDEDRKELKVQLQNDQVITLTTNDYTVNFNQPMMGEYKIPVATAAKDPSLITGFAAKVDEDASVPEYVDIKNTVLAEVTITPGGYNLAVEDLYDGLMLTTEGHDFFNMLKEAKAIRGFEVLGSNGVDKVTEANVAQKLYSKAGKTTFYVKVLAEKNANGLKEEVYTITGKDEANATRLATWMIKPQARVDILAGDNRYETAVEIAKEYADLTSVGTSPSNSTDANIVLVNGNALVDGLAAAPLAAKKVNTVYDKVTLSQKTVSAPILLTEADKLPKATKAYLKEILSKTEIGALDEVTIHLVGGESVLNKSLERELKGLGFSVERYGGDNREETSLEVAEAIGSTNKAFVVGAEGEADAMSIAAVAASQKTPIIVSKKGGISEDATYELRNKDVTVIGGKTVVSDADYKAIKSEAKGIQRVFGSNRQATNAEIIAKYYKDDFSAGVGSAENVIVAKDGQRNKMELVDALAAANMAAEKKAPIVLGTDKLSKDQINALELNAKKAKALYQVGIGVNKDKVVRIIAENLKLTNR